MVLDPGHRRAEPPGAWSTALPRFIATVRRAAALAIDWPAHRALFGFSQGAIMALEAAQAEPELAGCVIAFSGRYATLPGMRRATPPPAPAAGLDDAVLPHGSAGSGGAPAWWRWAPT